MLSPSFKIKADLAAQQTISNIFGRDTKAIIYVIPHSGRENLVRQSILDTGASEFKGLSNHIYIAALVTAKQAEKLSECPYVVAIVNKRGDQPSPSARPQ